MSGKLVGEVLDYAPADLSPRSVLLLVSIAENARDDTRTGWPGRDQLARRARYSEATVPWVIRGLIKRGLLVRVGAGYKGHRASYRIPPLKGGVQTPPIAESKGGVQTPPYEPQRVASDPLKGGVLDTTPSLNTSLKQITLSSATAQTLVGEWIEHCPKRPPQQVIGQVGKQLSGLIAEGIDAADVRAGLAAWARKGLHPSTIPSVVNEVMNGHGSNGHGPKPSTTDQRVAQGLALAAKYAQDSPKELTP